MPAIDVVTFEALAAQQHKQWSGWTEYMLDRLKQEVHKNSSMDLIDFEALPSVKRWRRQIATEYELLPFEEQESDRKEANDVLTVLGLEV